MTVAWKKTLFLYFLAVCLNGENLYSMKEPEEGERTMKGFSPSKTDKGKSKKAPDQVKGEDEEKGIEKGELKWDPKRQMYYYGNPLPDSSTKKSPKPLSQDNTKVIFQVGTPEKSTEK